MGELRLMAAGRKAADGRGLEDRSRRRAALHVPHARQRSEMTENHAGCEVLANAAGRIGAYGGGEAAERGP